MLHRNVDDWLKGYLVYTNELESPEDYHIWCGISAVASVLRRRVWFNMGYFMLYPNMYITLVSPPGLCKKSTAMRTAKELLRPVPTIEFASDSTSRERLIMDLSTAYRDGYSAMTAHSSEFGTMLTTSGMDMVVFLTDIFDCPLEWSHRTKVSGTSTIKAPYLNLLAGTTPDWMAKAMPLDTVGIGLTSRVCFVYQDTPRDRDPFPSPTPEQLSLGTLLTEDLAAMSNISGEYSFTPEAKEMYRDWYRNRTDRINDPRLTGYYERKPMHLIKVCMIYSAMRRFETIITVQELEDALISFSRIESQMPRVFAGVGRNPLNADTETVLSDMLTQPKGVSRAEVINRLRHSLRLEEIDEVLETLVMAGHATLRGGRYFVSIPSQTQDE